jgi:metallo-beta-lactamase family protein
MKLGFYGAARTVTGSKHLLTLNNGKKILLDCGMFQGMGQKTDELNESFGFDAATIDILIVSHAHIDHTGLIPKLVKEGFNGKIYSTQPTKELSEILLYDSAEIQTYDTDYNNRRRSEKGLPPYEPLYTSEDVEKTMELFETIGFDQPEEILPGVTLLFCNTGHLIGSACIHLTIEEEDKTKTIAFSGDIGRYRSILLRPPSEIPPADVIIMESTYGDKMHDPVFNTVDPILKWIKSTCVDRKGKLVIPAFSVGRTQEILYALNQLSLEKRLPEIPCYVDSPLSSKATAVIKKFTDGFNDRLQQVLEIDDDPFHFEGLNYIDSVEDSRKLAAYTEPCVIISSSGTADAGRVRFHIQSTIDSPAHSVVLVGYCQETSLGGQLLSGASTVDLMGEEIPVNAEVGKIASFSAHGDADDLCMWLDCQDKSKLKQIFLVHGEYETQKSFAARLERKEYKQVIIPGYQEEYQW